MVVSIGAVASAAQGVSYYERDGYYAKDDTAHREASAWFGKGAAALGLEGTVDPDLFTDILAGEVPDGSGLRLGRRNREGEIEHRPGRDLTFSCPKSVSLAALIGGDERIAGVHDAAVRKALAWIEANAAETRMMDPELGRMVRTGGQSIVAATFMHEVSRNLDPQLHTHAVIANMVLGQDGGTPRSGGTPQSGKWRTMANEKLYESKMLIGAVYRAELARGLEELGYAVEKTHADGRFEIAGGPGCSPVPRQVIEAFSTRRAEIEAAMATQGLGDPAANQRVAERAALVTRSHKRDVDKEALRESWQRQASELGFDAPGMVAEARHRQAAYPARSLTSVGRDREAEPGVAAEAARAAAWAVEHLSEREAVFARTDLLTATLAWNPGKVSIEEAEAAVGRMEKAGTLHAAKTPVLGDALTTDKALIDETETIALMERGQGRSKRIMRKWIATPLLHNGRLTQGQKEAVTTILSSRDRVLGVQGYAGTGKTAMLDRARALAEKSGWRMVGLAPSASAAATLGSEAGIRSETLQRFLARNAGVAEGRLKPGAEGRMRTSFRKTVLVVDEGSLASTVQARNLLRIADRLRIPRVVLVGDEKQLDAVDAGKPFAQLQRAGMKTVVMDEILRQKDPALKEAVRASLAGDVRGAFAKLGDSVAEVKADNLAGAAAARWLKLSPEERENTGLMAPSHALRQTVNGHIRERLARDGVIHGPAFESERLVSLGYTTAEKMQAANYAPGDVVAFHRAYKSLGVAKGEERRVREVDGARGTVMLEGPDGGTVPWRPRQVGASRGAVEVYRVEPTELRASDRILWTRNDAELGLVNSHAAEVTAVRGDRVLFLLEDGRRLELGRNQPQLRHLDHAWASTVHAFQGRTVDNVIAVMEANHPHLTTQKSFYVEISRARHRAELVTDDARALCDRLESATGERVSALEGVAAAAELAKKKEQARQAMEREAAARREREVGRDAPAREPAGSQTPAPARSWDRAIEPEALPGKPERIQPLGPARVPESERERVPAPRPVRAPEPAKAPEPVKERAPRQIERDFGLEL